MLAPQLAKTETEQNFDKMKTRNNNEQSVAVLSLNQFMQI